MPIFLDANFPDHPKTIAAGGKAAMVYVAAACFSNRWRVPGSVAKSRYPMVARSIGVVQHGVVLRRLLESGLFTEEEDRYVLDPAFVRFQSPASSRPWIPDALRAEVYERDGHACVECGSADDLTCDHILPVVRGGPTTLENLQTMCRSCNSKKGARVPTAARPLIDGGVYGA